MLRLAAIALLVAGSAAIASSAPSQPWLVRADQQLQTARSEAAAAEAERKRLEAAAETARNEAERLRNLQAAAAQAIASAEARITASEATARLLDARIAAERQRLAEQQAPLSSLLGGLALMGRRPPVLYLLGGASPEELVKMRALVSATEPAIRARTLALTTDLQHARRLQSAALAARQEARQSRSDLEQRRVHFAQLEDAAIRLARERGGEALGFADVSLAREEQAEELRQQGGEARSAAALARELARLGPVPLPGSSEATQRPPLDYRLPAIAPVVEGLGQVSSAGIRSRGVTLATRRGQALAAPAGGTILFAGPFQDYDGVVIIDHGGGWRSVLINAASTLSKGARIGSGQPLGTALGPLEVQLRRRGELVSPALIAGSSAMLSNTHKGG